jgi:hypothetical protein
MALLVADKETAKFSSAIARGLQRMKTMKKICNF